MFTRSLIASLLLSAFALSIPMRAECVRHEGDYLMKQETVQTAHQTKASDEFESYVQVYDEVSSDPEHAQARMVTPSYAIN